MTRGRCAGCGFEHASCKVVNSHILNCAAYKELFVTNPAAALEPDKEYERHKLEQGTDEAQAARASKRATKMAGHRQEADRKLQKQQERWKPRVRPDEPSDVAVPTGDTPSP